MQHHKLHLLKPFLNKCYCLLLWLVWCLCQVFMMSCVTKATPIHFTNDKCHVKRLRNCKTDLTSYYVCLSHKLMLMSLGMGKHTHANIFTKSVSRNQMLSKSRQQEKQYTSFVCILMTFAIAFINNLWIVSLWSWDKNHCTQNKMVILMISKFHKKCKGYCHKMAKKLAIAYSHIRSHNI